MKSQDFKWQGFIHLAAVDLVSPMGLTYSTDVFNSDTDTVQSDSEGSGHSDEAEADITIDRIAENGIRAPASASTAAVRGVDRWWQVWQDSGAGYLCNVRHSTFRQQC